MQDIGMTLSVCFMIFSVQVFAACGFRVKNATDSHTANDTSADLAVYSVYVRSKDAYRHDDFLREAARMKCSAGETTIPFHLLFIDDTGEGHRGLHVLQDLGWLIEDHTSYKHVLKSYYKPLYDEADAKRLHRKYRAGGELQHRTDGWATYLKFFAWLAPYRKVIIADLDVTFTQALDKEKIVRAVRGTDFAAPSRPGGLHTFLMVASPSRQSFNRLMYWARTGDYLPFTNGEQDVIESHWGAGTLSLDTILPNVHNKKGFNMDNKACASLAFKTCAQFREACL